MEGFTLRIVTPDGIAFDGTAREVIVRTAEGDVGILPNHIRYLATIDYGKARIILPDGTERLASCMNGFVSVDNNLVRIIVTTFEFSDRIDIDRARRAKEKAEQRIAERKSESELVLAEAKLRRALMRIHVYDESQKM